MLCRTAILPLANASKSIPARNMATLREIEGRLKSIRNIAKITTTMKTVASTKLARAQKAMSEARAYGKASNVLFETAETSAPSEAKTLIIAVSSDKGLCGGIHSSVTKAAKKVLAIQPEAEIVVLGDKSKTQLSRQVPQNLVMTFNQIGRSIPTFADAQTIADQIISSGIHTEKIEIVYNEFKSAISYEPATVCVYSEELFKNSPNFGIYEIEDDVLTNLKEFALANAIYWALVEGHACEQSARRNSMENASKNAGEMIHKFSLLYNRTRQQVITGELIDIITGASAL